jgi:hypothetical protein
MVWRNFLLLFAQNVFFFLFWLFLLFLLGGVADGEKGGTGTRYYKVDVPYPARSIANAEVWRRGRDRGREQGSVWFGLPSRGMGMGMEWMGK